MRLSAMTDEGIGEAIGKRIQALRLKANISQEKVAQEAGLARRTVHQLETHGKGTVANMVAVLRAIGELDRLASLLEEVRPSPLRVVEMHGKTRLRAAPRGAVKQAGRKLAETPLAPTMPDKDTDW